MTETRETDKGSEVAANSGWTVNRETDDTAGDVIDDDIVVDRHGEAVRLVQLPTVPVDDRDPGVPPACAYDNAPQQVSERVGEAVRHAVENGERVVVQYQRPYGRNPRFGTIEAIDTKTGDGWRYVVEPFAEDGIHVATSDDFDRIVSAPFDPDEVGIYRADYAEIGVESGEIKAFACHACVQR